jgi:hypothetical protein
MEHARRLCLLLITPAYSVIAPHTGDARLLKPKKSAPKNG